MTTGRETARVEKGSKIVFQERCSSRGTMRMKGETNSPALRSTGSRPGSPRMERETVMKQRDVSNTQPTVDELLKTVKRLEKGFLSLADAVIAEIEGMREDARCWQEEREELWKTVMAFHSHQKSDMEPIYHRLESLEKRTSDIEKHLQSRGPDTTRGIPANDRLEDLERRCELDKQVKRQHTHFLHGPHQTMQEKLLFNDELGYKGSSKLEGSRRLGLSSRNSDAEETLLAVQKEIEELRVSSKGQMEIRYYLSAFSQAMNKLQAWCKLLENDQVRRLQRLTESGTDQNSFLDLCKVPVRRCLDWE